MLDDVLSQANSVRLLALSRSDRRVLALLLVRLAALSCACGENEAKKCRMFPQQIILSSAITD